MRPFAIYHEHPDWFRPLFAELERRGIPFIRLDPRAHCYDPAEKSVPYSLLFNRMSPSAYLRGGVQGMFFTLGFLAHLERLRVPVVNGSKGFAVELSKARQLTLLESLGLGYPKARVINHASRAAEACDGMWSGHSVTGSEPGHGVTASEPGHGVTGPQLRFPVVVKANIGGSGAGIVKFSSRDALAAAANAGELDFGVDHTALVQEYVPARGGHITRVETLGGKYLYAIKVFTTGESFNLCPADICQRADGVELVRSACPVDAPKSGMKVEGYTPPPEVIAACESIMQTAGIDVGGIEYMIDDRDGSLVYYDINALSNFVADAVNVVGFDPFARLVDYLVKRSHGERGA